MLDRELVTGFLKLDKDHGEILSLVDLLTTTNPEDRRIIFSALIRYITDHCTTEEILMRDHDYPGLEKHRNLHRKMQDDFISSFHGAISSRANSEVLKKIRQSIFDHILIEDKKFILFLQENKK